MKFNTIMKNNSVFNLLIVPVIVCFNFNLGFSQNNAILMNGVSDYVEMSDHNALDFIDKMSIEAWIKPMTEMSVADQVIVGKQWCYGFDYAYYFGVFGNKLRFVWNTPGDCNFSSSFETDNQIIGAGECYHVAVVFNSQHVQFYVNGSPVSGSLVLGNYGTIHNSNSPLRIGCYRANSGEITNFFYGELDEIRMWNYELSPIEINSRMNISLGGGETGLVAYYQMDESDSGSGLTVENSAMLTGNALNGITYGSGLTPSFVPSCFKKNGLNRNETISHPEIYPNPGKGIFNIEAGTSGVINFKTVEVYDVFGKKVSIAQIENGILDLSYLSAGIYMLNFLTDCGVLCEKIILN